jgi:hypothetical protein
MQNRHGVCVEHVVLHGRPVLRVTDRHGYDVGYYRTGDELAQVVDVPSLVDGHPLGDQSASVSLASSAKRPAG